MISADRAATRLATRLAFLVAGFGVSCWAPLVPLAKQRVGVSDAGLGLLLLCIGIGSVAAMLATGPLLARQGSRPVVVASGLTLTAVLPMLVLAGQPALLGALLLVFGGALGALDVAMNVHALFSIGGFAGSGLVTALLSAALPPFATTLVCAAMMLAAMLVTWPRLLVTRAEETAPFFVLPRGRVLLLAGLAAVTFLVEGAMLDWSAVLVTGQGLLRKADGGLGYMLFAVAMTIGRLAGDRVTARIGDRRTMWGGGLAAVGGFVVLLAAMPAPVALAGFVLIGLGASNIVPVLFRQAGRQASMPAALAVGAITTTGSAGVLLGPAAIGFVAHETGLSTAFWLLAALLCLVPLGARRACGGPGGVLPSR